jgi:hypothetical protein
MTWTREQIRENRQRWVADLRSGRYPQASGCLVRLSDSSEEVVGYCCLGVATVGLGLDGPGEVNGDVLMFDNNTTALPNATREALGFEVELPMVLWQGRVAALHQLNDSCLFTLDEIADVIEDQADDWDGTCHRAQPYWRDTDDVPRPTPRSDTPVSTTP